MPDSYYFVSYSRHDAEVVHRVVEELQRQGIQTWQDTMLVPGENWAQAITEALRRAVGIILFVSRASMESEWVRRELQVVASQPQSFVIPVILEDVADLPEEIRSVQWVDARRMQGDKQVSYISQELAHAIMVFVGTKLVPSMPLDEEDLDELAQASVAKARGAEGVPSQAAATAPDSIFIVHGHDLALRDEVKEYIASLDINPIVLAEISDAQQSLWQKFINFGGDVRFAVVLISADDWGASRRQFDLPNVGERALQFRARQNVILELGFFYGRLDWEHVFVLYKPPDIPFPNFERPSDLAGAVFDEVDPDGRWQAILAERLRNMGFDIP